MKKSVIASVLGVCLIFAIGTMTFLLFKNNENKSAGSDGMSKSAYGDYIKKGMESKTRTVNLLGEEKKVTYKYTENSSDLSVEKRADSYGTTDVFVDAEKNEYEFLYGTNTLCGYMYRGNHEPITDEMKKPIELSDEEITKQCDSYLKELYPNNNYKLGEIIRDQNSQEYGAIYYFYLNKIKTDDVFSINFNRKGELLYFAAFKFQRYEKYANSKLNLEKTEKSFQEKLKDVKAENIRKQITLTDEGDLVIKYQYYDANEHYTKEIYEKILEQ